MPRKRMYARTQEYPSYKRREFYRVEMRERIGKYKIEIGCEMCGYKKNSVALDFDHRIPGEKSFHIARRYYKSFEELMVEIKKCRVLCANCHRIESYSKGHLSHP